MTCTSARAGPSGGTAPTSQEGSAAASAEDQPPVAGNPQRASRDYGSRTAGRGATAGRLVSGP
jgi:hypothetical protein